MRLSRIIASSSRQKILMALAKVDKTYVTKLVRMINSTYLEVNRNLIILQEEGIVSMKRLGHLRVIELQRSNPRTLALLKALELLERPICSENVSHSHQNSN
jgi:DNA-binding transcriptional ArsR family regulator